MAATSLSYSHWGADSSAGLSSGTGPHILVVDNGPDIIESMCNFLISESYKVTHCTTGIDALARMQKGLRPDVVLLDHMMPDTDGLQTLDRMKAIDPTVRVVMLSPP